MTKTHIGNWQPPIWVLIPEGMARFFGGTPAKGPTEEVAGFFGWERRMPSSGAESVHCIAGFGFDEDAQAQVVGLVFRQGGLARG